MALSKTPAKAAAQKAATPAKAAKAPAAKATKAAPAKAAATAKKAATAHPPKKTAKRDVPLEQRRNYVQVAAYYIAERHGFTPGRELDDWAAAEAEIDRLLAAGLITP